MAGWGVGSYSTPGVLQDRGIVIEAEGTRATLDTDFRAARRS